jgi:hypothetical protein
MGHSSVLKALGKFLIDIFLTKNNALEQICHIFRKIELRLVFQVVFNTQYPIIQTHLLTNSADIFRLNRHQSLN